MRRIIYGVEVRRALDRIQSLAALAALDPAAIVGELAAELPAAGTLAELEARDTALATALADIDAACTRYMRIRLDHALADDTSLALPTRRVFAQTIASYAGRLALLVERARDVAARGGARDPERIAELVAEAARATFADRDALRAPVLALVRDLAAAAVAEADRRARDRQLADAERKRWSAARRDLESTAADPERIASAPMPARLAALPEQLDEPDPAREPTRAELLELD